MQFNKDRVDNLAAQYGFDPSHLEKAAKTIIDGGIVAFPTETFYGLGARYDSASALGRLCEIKERPNTSPFGLLVTNWAMAERLVAPGVGRDATFRRFTEQIWPGPVTLVLPAAEGLDDAIQGENGAGRPTVALRVSPHPVAHSLVEWVGRPITCPSANHRGDAPAATAERVQSSGLAGLLDFVLDAGETPGDKTSTILELNERAARILRQGAVSAVALSGPLATLGVALDGNER